MSSRRRSSFSPEPSPKKARFSTSPTKIINNKDHNNSSNSKNNNSSATASGSNSRSTVIGNSPSKNNVAGASSSNRLPVGRIPGQSLFDSLNQDDDAGEDNSTQEESEDDERIPVASGSRITRSTSISGAVGNILDNNRSGVNSTNRSDLNPSSLIPAENSRRMEEEASTQDESESGLNVVTKSLGSNITSSPTKQTNSSTRREGILTLGTSLSPPPQQLQKKNTVTSCSPSPPPAPKRPISTDPSASHLSCPICLGPPTPLVTTICGHTFCGPCLHAALVAGGGITPEVNHEAQAIVGGRPIRGGGWRGGGGRGGMFGPGANRGGGAPGSGGRNIGGLGVNNDVPPSELDGHCPVCRTILRGGWGHSIRGLTLRMIPVEKIIIEVD